MSWPGFSTISVLIVETYNYVGLDASWEITKTTVLHSDTLHTSVYIYTVQSNQCVIDADYVRKRITNKY